VQNSWQERNPRPVIVVGRRKMLAVLVNVSTAGYVLKSYIHLWTGRTLSLISFGL
jgi:hypothetical protein